MKKAKEFAAVLTAAFLFGIMPALIKNAYNYGANGFNITFYMALLSIPIYLVILLCTGSPIKLPGKRILHCLIAGVADTGTFLLLYLSYSYIPVGVATMLNFIYPVTVALAMHFLYRESFGPKKIAALAIYLLGLASLYGGDITGNVIGFILAILSGISYTVHAIFMDKSGLSEENVYTVGLYKAVTVAVITGIAGILMRVPMHITGWGAWSSILVCTILCRVVSHALLMIAIRGLGAFLPSVLSTIEPIVAVLTGWLLLNEELTVLQWLGMILVLLSVIMIILSDAVPDVSPDKASGLE